MPTTMVEYTEAELQTQALLETLAKIGGKHTAEEDIIFQGKKLILPENMTLSEAITFLNEKLREDEQTMQFARTFLYRPWDGARATMIALKKAFGAVAQRGVPGFFGMTPPKLITINTSPSETEQVPWGALGVVHMPGITLYLGVSKDAEYGEVYSITAEGPRKWRHHIEGIFRLIENELKENSLYRGKAFDGQKQPKFIDLSGVDRDKVIYSDLVQEQLEANVWSIIKYPNTLAELGVSLKRAVLLEGPYGTGKTLAALLTAQIAISNGWSFLMCRPGQDDLFNVMATARLYQPAVVFFEDIDILAEGGGSVSLSQLLDIFDGIQAKSSKLLIVLTTNHVERIHKGMVRPGRLDAVIHIGALDARGIQRLVEATVPEHMLDDHLNWDLIVESMAGFLPAFCREAIDRAVRYNVARNLGKATKLGTPDFVAAAQGLRPQLELMEGAKEGVIGDELKVAFEKIVGSSVKAQVTGAEVYEAGGGDLMYELKPSRKAPSFD